MGNRRRACKETIRRSEPQLVRRKGRKPQISQHHQEKGTSAKSSCAPAETEPPCLPAGHRQRGCPATTQRQASGWACELRQLRHRHPAPKPLLHRGPPVLTRCSPTRREAAGPRQSAAGARGAGPARASHAHCPLPHRHPRHRVTTPTAGCSWMATSGGARASWL